MVNWVAAQKPLYNMIMKQKGLRPQSVEIEEGTVMNIWAPIKNENKPAVVFIHGFAAEGIVTWQFQVGSFTKKYSVYVPDLLFFGKSTTNTSDRSPGLQAASLMKGLKKLGVDKYVVIGFSYGGMVAFKMAEISPETVLALVISGSVISLTDSLRLPTLQRLGFHSSTELLLPTSVRGLKSLLRVATHKKLWFPNFLYRDYLEVMFTNRKERSELLEGLVISNKDVSIPQFSQRILLLWGANDQIFHVDLANHMREQLGEKVQLITIPKAGHLVHLERPCVYTRHIKEFLSTIF